MEVVGGQFRQHHPASKVILEVFQLLNDGQLGLLVFAEVDFGDGPGIRGLGRRAIFHWQRNMNQRQPISRQGQPCERPSSGSQHKESRWQEQH